MVETWRVIEENVIRRKSDDGRRDEFYQEI